MMERYTAKPKGKVGGDYFPDRSLEFVSSGCTLLDCVLGGGWVLGRPVNIVGDKSVGKTLLWTEAAANFARQFKKGHIWARESEAAFDIPYAKTVGLPADRVDFGPEGIETLWDTADQIFDDSEKCIKLAAASGQPGLYVIDSLDSLSSADEIDRDRTKGTYGTAKPKVMSEMFRVLVRDFKRTRICYMVISQIRDKIGPSFGVKYTRAGGKALDFYSNQTVYLSHLGTLYKTINGIKRAWGVRIKAKCTKNKVSTSFGECEFTLKFGYGIDDLSANVDWLGVVKKLPLIGIKGEEQATKYLTQSEKLPDADYFKQVAEVRAVVQKVWHEVDVDFQPKRQKYGS
jgi:recombination protein RecA